jgi:hypothetical protein
MADFDETRAGYRGAAQKVAAGRDALVAASERVRALEKQLEQVARRSRPGDRGWRGTRASCAEIFAMHGKISSVRAQSYSTPMRH